VDSTTWFLWSTLLAVACWSSLALSHNRLWIASLCLAASLLAPKISLLLQKKEHIEIVAIPPYQFFTIASHEDCITYISQTHKTASHPTWQRWLNSLTCTPTVVILAQQDLWRESHAIRLHTNPKLTAVYSPEKTFSTHPCASGNKKNPHLACTLATKGCQCTWKAAQSTLNLEPDTLQIHRASSPTAATISATTAPQEITFA
jgi:hypothetical protein